MREIPIGVSEEIFELAPGYRRAVIVGGGIQNKPSNSELQKILRSQEQKTRQTVTLGDERLEAWREAFRNVGIKPNKFRPSIDALTRRVINDLALPSISTLVDIGTVLSLRHVLPCGAHSLNDVVNGLELKRASGTELFTPFGTEKSETIPAGEVIFSDGNTVATSKWAWRQAVHTIIRSDTTAFELNIDALPIIDDDTLEIIVADAQNLIKDFLGLETSVLLLSIDNPTATISL